MDGGSDGAGGTLRVEPWPSELMDSREKFNQLVTLEREIRAAIDSIEMRGGLAMWHLRLTCSARLELGSVELRATFDVPDRKDPSSNVTVMNWATMPLPLTDAPLEAQALAFVMSHIKDTVMHEMRESVFLDGAPFDDPHAGTGQAWSADDNT